MDRLEHTVWETPMPAIDSHVLYRAPARESIFIFEDRGVTGYRLDVWDHMEKHQYGSQDTNVPTETERETEEQSWREQEFWDKIYEKRRPTNGSQDPDYW